MKYEKATAEVVMFDNSDVITTSGCEGWAQSVCSSGNGWSWSWCSGMNQG